MSLSRGERLGEQNNCWHSATGRPATVSALLGLLVLVLTTAIRAQDASAARQVLVLQSTDRGSMVFDRFTEEFRAALVRRAGAQVTLFDMVIAPPGFADAPDQPVIEFLRSLYANRPPPELVVTVGAPAAAFARRNRPQLFTGAPIVYAALEQRALQSAPLGEDESAVTVATDLAASINDILQVLPETQTVFMVSGSGAFRNLWAPTVREIAARFGGRPIFLWADGLSYEQMLQRAATLPPHSAIYYGLAGTFGSGSWQGDERTLADLSARANAPVFGLHRAWFGSGTVGGHLLNIEGLGDTTADVVMRILNGDSPRTIRIPPRTKSVAEYDARLLERWNIPETRLPPGSQVRFRAPSLWRDYRREVLGVSAALFAQMLLIGGLLYQRQARRRAETDSRRNLTLAADANRRLTVSALTSSIMHELSQPMGSILSNAEAGEMMLTSGGATPDELQAILADIRIADVQATEIIDRHRTLLRSHEFDAKPIDIRAVVRESVALIAKDAVRRQIQLAVELPRVPCTVIGDKVLLQQVVVNLMTNAMDAMANTPAEPRCVTVWDEVGPTSVKLSVRDAGSGFTTALKERLFQPFVTTKANGLGIGLTIVRAIVETHGGTIDAAENATGGAIFTVTLPLNGRL